MTAELLSPPTENGQAASAPAGLMLVDQLAAEPLVVRGRRAITLPMMDRLHERPDGTARRNLNQHADRFVEGRHYITAPYAEWSSVLSGRNSSDQLGGYRGDMKFLIERGYLLLVKTFQDDLAWEVQEKLIDCYFHVKEQAAPQTVAEMLLVQCRALVDNERRTKALEGRVSSIETVQQEAAAHLEHVERSPEPAPEKSLRAKINELVRLFCQKTGTKFDETWRRLYKELYYRCHFDAKARAKASGGSALDAIETAGQLADLYSIASEVLTF